MIVMLMGVSGSGKTTVGKVLAQSLGWSYIDADEYHPPSNVEKMRHGIPLTDEDRRPWLEALRRVIDEAVERGENIVLGCSALKHSYQDYLKHEHGEVKIVWLSGSPQLIQERLAHRTGHFMDPHLLPSQFQTLEPPENAIQVDISPPPEQIAAEIRKRLGL